MKINELRTRAEPVKPAMVTRPVTALEVPVPKALPPWKGEGYDYGVVPGMEVEDPNVADSEEDFLERSWSLMRDAQALLEELGEMDYIGQADRNMATELGKKLKTFMDANVDVCCALLR